MKDYFYPEYHAYRAAVEDYGRRMTAALIEYVEDADTNLEVIAERNRVQLPTLSKNARRFIREEYHRSTGPRPDPKAMSEKAREIVYLTREGGMSPAQIAKEVGVSRQYVYDVQAKYRKQSQ